MEEEKKKKHVSENITKVVRCLRPAPAGWWVQFAKEEEEKKDGEREGEKARKVEKEDGEGLLSSSFRA